MIADNITSEERSDIMRRVKNKNTRPEIAFRKLLWNMGYRYRKNVTKLPGQPDIVFKGKKKVIFIHGCFWHRHEGCQHTRTPKSKVDFWTKKFEDTKKRDQRTYDKLRENGWNYLIVWECEIKEKNYECLREKIYEFMTKH